ncbi:hypothetical protein QBC39DRAFT_121283 [Podospora conica]|nr:hypothetical protein QBC39DRAFT_121283 [Schizothecium conicum]
MSGFPKLIPAFTALVPISPPTPLGPTARGGPLNHVTILPEQGSLVSDPSYPIRVDAVFVSGADFIRADPSGTHVRLQVDALLRDGPTGAHIRLSYTGTIATAGTGAGKVFAGASDAATTAFGDAFIHGTFETGHPDLAAMQSKVYVGAGRFILEEGKPVVVEYKFSEVVA